MAEQASDPHGHGVMTPPLVRHQATRGGFMKGCLIVAGILAVLLLVVGVVVASKWKGWAAQATTSIAEKALASSGLPQAQRDQLTLQVRSLARDFESGRLTTAELERIMRNVANGPLIPASAVLAARQKYLEPSDMSAAEKAAAVRALQRYARGLFAKTVPVDSVENVTASIVQPPEGNITQSTVISLGNQRVQFKNQATRPEIDRFVSLARQAADTAGIPDEAFEPDWGAELTKAINAARKGP